MDILLCILIGYLLGCLNPAALFSKLKKIDLRKEGTGNLGATNATMVLGRKCGALVLLFDVAKSYVAVKLAQRLFPAFFASGLIAGAAAVTGHIFPFYLKFKGGKGLASFAGYILGIDPLLLVILFVFCFSLMLLINYSVAAPMAAAMLFPILYGIRTCGDASVLIVTAVSALIIFKHFSNIEKARSGKDIKVRDYLRDHLFVKREQ